MRPNKKSKPKKIKALAISTARADYLAANPKVKKIQDAAIQQFNKYHLEATEAVAASKKNQIKAVNAMRRAGVAADELEETLPGKQFTFDFHLQLAGDGEKQIHANLDVIQKYQFVARNLPKDIKTIEEVQQFQTVFKYFLGIESARGQQVIHAQKSPLDELKEILHFNELEDVWKRLRETEQYCPGGRFRDDLRATLRVELEPTFKLVDELRKELGI